MKNNSRREFLKTFAQVTGVSIIAGPGLIKAAFGQEKKRGESAGAGAAAAGKEIDWPVVVPGKDLALAMAYHHSHAEGEKDAKTDKKTDKGIAWDKRFCDNCSFYKAVGKKAVDGKDADVGTCTIFPKALVAAKGICNSWAKKG